MSLSLDILKYLILPKRTEMMIKDLKIKRDKLKKELEQMKIDFVAYTYYYNEQEYDYEKEDKMYENSVKKGDEINEIEKMIIEYTTQNKI